ncbi:MAG: hypothetical protein VX815_18875 [Gemmatimonadota bacterium]|nr:hypothetical protein [Gemmatimonadota bacterium]
MKKWLRRIRGAVGMGLTWAAGWALVVVLMGVTTILLPGTWLDLIFAAADDELLMATVLPAFTGGVVFSTVLGIAGRHRRFDELSLPQFAAWGAIGGLLLSLFPAAVMAMGAASVAQAALTIALVTLLSAVSASGSLMLARLGEDRELLDASAAVAEVGLTGAEAQELLGDG